jgi:mevalonate pyrophosphate decarboxylase
MVDSALCIEGVPFPGARLVREIGAGKNRKTFQTFDAGSKSVVYCKASLLTTQTANAKANAQRRVRRKSVQTLK